MSSSFPDATVVVVAGTSGIGLATAALCDGSTSTIDGGLGSV